MPSFATGLTQALTQGATGAMEGQHEAEMTRNALLVTAMNAMRQKALAQSTIDKNDSTINVNGARANHYNNPAPTSIDQRVSRFKQLLDENGGDRAKAAEQLRQELGGAPSFDPIAVHKQERQYDVSHPMPSRASTAGTSTPNRQRWILGRAVQLSKPQNVNGMTKPGLAFQDAVKQANTEFDSSNGAAPAAPGGAAPGPIAAPHGASGIPPEAMAESQAINARAKAALAANADPAKVAARMSQLQEGVARKYGIGKYAATRQGAPGPITLPANDDGPDPDDQDEEDE